MYDEQFRKIVYRTVEGVLIEETIDTEHGVTMTNIENLTLQYLEHTFREPHFVFMRSDQYSKFLKEELKGLAGPISATSQDIMSVHTSVGNIPIKVISNLYCPVFVGTQTELENNDVDKIFEETVLKDCDRE